jgi:threonine/homoserine/homoserine lactone efflux protein
MSQSLLIAFVVFAVVMFFTPGPNNVMLLSSGLTHGFRRTLPLIAGITIGFAFMVAAVGLGLGTIFIAYPVLQTILKYAGAAYLIYLAATIAMSGTAPSGQENQRGPMTFWGAAVFQWVNVKGWVMVIGTITAYSAIASFPWNIIIQTAISLLMGALSTVTWALFGSALRPVLTSPRAVRAFLQYRDGSAAAGIALSGLHGRMMPQRAMQKRVSPQVKNGLDNAGNRQPNPPRLQKT